MSVLLRVLVVVVAVALSGCVVVPVTPDASTGTSTLPSSEKSTCPAFFFNEGADAALRYARPDVWAREGYKEPISAYPLYRCEWMRPIIKWAVSASKNEWDKGDCKGSATSFSCESASGPTGTSRHREKRVVKGGRLQLGVAAVTLRGCPDAASETRKLSVKVFRYGSNQQFVGWNFRAEEVCNYRYLPK